VIGKNDKFKENSGLGTKNRLSKSQDHIVSIHKPHTHSFMKRQPITSSVLQLTSPKLIKKDKITKYTMYQTNIPKKDIDPKFLIKWRKKVEDVVDTR
jgi:hypothetical protein